MWEINDKVVYVKGALNGAIYNFNINQVFAIDNDYCHILDGYIIGKSEAVNTQYLNQLEEINLINASFQPRKYLPEVNKDIKLNLVWLEITQKCNLKCIHCYEGQTHVSSKRVLQLVEWTKLIDDLIEFGARNFIVIGGEPTCSNHVIKILQYLSKFNVKVTLFTNATLISKNLFETIIDTGTKVKVSVYGHCADIHDRITTIKGSFDRMVANIKQLHSAGVEITSSIIIMRENETFLEEIIRFTKSLGMKFYKYDVIRNVYGGSQCIHAPLTQKIISKVYMSKPNFHITKAKFDSAFYTNTCWYGKISITETGDVLPCVFERNMVYGNVLKTGIKEILNGSNVEKYWFFDFSNIETCKLCEYRFACKDCRPLGVSCNGDIKTKNPRCTYNPLTGVWNKPSHVSK